ncbi:single-stranded-DNA-specific exonuclease RecJ [Candidatus Woesebacteria bacterium]|nr:single-stranded-DNA-specific exonuclease RecJ [Candidatus Woesebacteria bacterium]
MRIRVLHSSHPQTLSELKTILIDNRHITNSKLFFNPPHPTQLQPADVGISVEELKKAVKIIQEAISGNKKIVIFGDYDADGICATATLWRCLHEAGAAVFPFIPDRKRHGYGLTSKGIDELIEQYHPDLIITVDNGIVAHQAIKYATDLGIQVIISDHHQKEHAEDGTEIFTTADAVVHTTALCGTTVAWFLGASVHQEAAAEALDLCALATLADQVPLTHYNRSFAVHGLQALRETERPGLLALLELAQSDQATLTEQDVSYGLAPRINAMGRLSHGLDALRLLCTTHLATAEKLAVRLQETNTERQDLTKDQYEAADIQQKSQSEEHVLVVHSATFHEGIIGLIAGKLAEKYFKPVVVIATNGETGKGSARSITGVNITDLLRSVRSDLLEVGGHPMAGGFSIQVEKIAIFQQRLFELARAEIQPELLVRETVAECLLPTELCTLETYAVVQQFAPFGAANTKPQFLLEDLQIESSTVLGKNQQHLKLILSSTKTGESYTALWWGAGHQLDTWSPGKLVNVVAQLAINEWKGKKTLQLILKVVQEVEK